MSQQRQASAAPSDSLPGLRDDGDLPPRYSESDPYPEAATVAASGNSTHHTAAAASSSSPSSPPSASSAPRPTLSAAAAVSPVQVAAVQRPSPRHDRPRPSSSSVSLSEGGPVLPRPPHPVSSSDVTSIGDSGLARAAQPSHSSASSSARPAPVSARSTATHFPAVFAIYSSPPFAGRPAGLGDPFSMCRTFTLAAHQRSRPLHFVSAPLVRIGGIAAAAAALRHPIPPTLSGSSPP